MILIPQDQSLFMLKALADESRLFIFRKLYDGEHSVGDLAQSIELSEPTVSHHLSRLREAGLVTLRMAGNQRFYRINPTGLERFKTLIARIDIPITTPEYNESDDQWLNELDWSQEDKQVLREYTRNGCLTSLPSRQKKTLVILRWLATFFQPEKMYTEIEVNAILKAKYSFDYVSLRRDLVDFGYLRRERGGGKYWASPDGSDVLNVDK
jgi:DNA-binding HxlR family transcriptional regulator